MAKETPEEYVQQRVIEARRQVARCSCGEAELEAWIAAGLAIQLAGIRVGECVQNARKRASR